MEASEGLKGGSLGASLTVKDLTASVAWYSKVLGFMVETKHERGGTIIAVSLRAGAVQILLTQDNGEKGLDRIKGEGFSLQITTKQSVDDLAGRIKGAGGTLDLEPTTMPWGARVLRLHDPDGFRFAITSTQEGP